MAHYQKRYQKYSAPTKFPAVVTFNRDGLSFDFYVANPEAYEAFKMNVGQLEGVPLKAVADSVGDAGVNVDALRSCLVNGADWREKRQFESDGPERVCSGCYHPVQPVKIPWKNGKTGQEGIGGNFYVRKIIEIEKFLQNEKFSFSDDFKSEYRARHDALTTDAMSSPNLPSTVRAACACLKCRELLQATSKVRFVAFDGLLEELEKAESGIVSSMMRTAYAEASTRRRPDSQRPDNRDSRPNGYRGNNTGGRDNRRPRGERKAWNGVEYFPQVADQLVRLASEGKIPNSLEGLLAKSPMELEALGLENAAKIQELAQSHLNWLEREAKKAEVAGSGTVSLGEIAGTHKPQQRRNRR